MPKAPDFDTTAAHEYFAAHCFNSSWTLIDKAERTRDEEVQLVALGQASLWHWTQRADCSDVNLSIGHWLLSRIYCVLRQASQAQRYADSCMEISRRPGVAPFYLAFAHEALARTAALREDWPAAAAALQQARALAEHVDDTEDRKALLADLETIRTGPAG